MNGCSTFRPPWACSIDSILVLAGTNSYALPRPEEPAESVLSVPLPRCPERSREATCFTARIRGVSGQLSVWGMPYTPTLHKWPSRSFGAAKSARVAPDDGSAALLLLLLLVAVALVVVLEVVLVVSVVPWTFRIGNSHMGQTLTCVWV